MILIKAVLTPIIMFFLRIYLFITQQVMIGNSCYVKNVKFGKSVRIEDRCRLSGNPNIVLGDNFYLNAGCHLLGDIAVGRNVMIGPQTIIWSRDHGMRLGLPMMLQEHSSKKIVIEDDVWISANVTILKGVTLHQGCVVAAGSVVTKDVSANSIVAGVPAKFIKMRE